MYIHVQAISQFSLNCSQLKKQKHGRVKITSYLHFADAL